VQVTTRSTPDPGGKVVDVHPGSGEVLLILFTADGTTREALRDEVLSLLRELAGCGEPSLAERDIPVWYLRLQERPAPPPERGHPALVGIALPGDLSTRAFEWFWSPLSDRDEYWTSEGGDLEELQLEPMLRYDHGRVVVYGDPFDGPQPVPDGADELRSAEKPAATVQRPSLRAPAPPDDVPASHDVRTWADTAERIQDWVDELWGATDLDELRRTVLRFGIAVHDEPDAAAVGKYGSLRTGWLQADGTCTVRILLAPEHHDDLSTRSSATSSATTACISRCSTTSRSSRSWPGSSPR
jgi:hypothetical protein